MVVAQMVEQLLPTPEVCSSNTVMNILSLLFTLNYMKDENKEKEAGNGHSLRNNRFKYLASEIIVLFTAKMLYWKSPPMTQKVLLLFQKIVL